MQASNFKIGCMSLMLHDLREETTFDLRKELLVLLLFSENFFFLFKYLKME